MTSLQIYNIGSTKLNKNAHYCKINRFPVLFKLKIIYIITIRQRFKTCTRKCWGKMELIIDKHKKVCIFKPIFYQPKNNNIIRYSNTSKEPEVLY